jgi:Gly-Xaa carboxypeptidase
LHKIWLTASLQVVPIQDDTLSDWKYPPFSGYFDGTYINGRGAHDCKNNVVGIMSAIEALLDAGFKPRRTVVLGFGFDEESPTLMLGANYISRHLKRVWGDRFEDSLPFALLLDEGLIGIQKKYNRTFGIPQASEKGMLDVKFRVHVPGGHSSTPPAHGSIGILSQVVSAMEDSYRSNFPSSFTSNNPFYYQIQCAAEDVHADIPSVLRDAIRNQHGRTDINHPELTELLVKEDPESDIYLHTTQAITIFNSGNKANVIPENAEMLANYRISNEENIATVQGKIVETVKPIAEKFNLRFIVREEDDDDEYKELPMNALSISWWRRIEPSPVSSHQSSAAWANLAGVIKHVFDEPGVGNDVIVAPTMAVGNTDTKYYWDLSEQIYRFGPVRAWHDEGWGNLHSVNERVCLLTPWREI